MYHILETLLNNIALTHVEQSRVAILFKNLRILYSLMQRMNVHSLFR